VFKRNKPDEEPAMPANAAAQRAFGSALPASDSSLDVPPFRPAAPASSLFKETPMGRPPFAPPAGATPAPTAAQRPAGQPATRPSGPTRDSAAGRRTLVVGRGISLQGIVQDAERLVVEGQVEATMIHAAELAVSPGGVFKGEVEVEDAEIAGTVEGTITARGNLIVRATGVVLGTARCRRLQVEDGGQITGRIEMLTDPRTQQRTQAEPVIRQAAEAQSAIV
jgi:cytoskeletal protein CcmA (bactofilin family)